MDKLRELLEGNKIVGYTIMSNLTQMLERRLASTREAFVYDRTLLKKQLDG